LLIIALNLAVIMVGVSKGHLATFLRATRFLKQGPHGFDTTAGTTFLCFKICSRQTASHSIGWERTPTLQLYGSNYVAKEQFREAIYFF
jgi:hypothetical protein